MSELNVDALEGLLQLTTPPPWRSMALEYTRDSDGMSRHVSEDTDVCLYLVNHAREIVAALRELERRRAGGYVCEVCHTIIPRDDTCLVRWDQAEQRILAYRHMACEGAPDAP